MATKKRKPVKIYEDDSVMVEQTFPDDDVAVIRDEIMRDISRVSTDKEEMTVDVSDVLDTFAGYMVQKVGMNDPENGSGECVLCGASTQYKLRKVCVPCLEKHRIELWQEAKTAIENGDRTFTIEVMNKDGK